MRFLEILSKIYLIVQLIGGIGLTVLFVWLQFDSRDMD